MACHGRWHQPVGGVALARSVHPQGGLRAVGGVQCLGQGLRARGARAGHGQVRTALQGLGHQRVQLGVAQGAPPLRLYVRAGLRGQRQLCWRQRVQRPGIGPGAGAGPEQKGRGQGRSQRAQTGAPDGRG